MLRSYMENAVVQKGVCRHVVHLELSVSFIPPSQATAPLLKTETDPIWSDGLHVTTRHGTTTALHQSFGQPPEPSVREAQYP